MNAKTSQILDSALYLFPDIEQPALSFTHRRILAFLATQTHPRTPKTISIRLNILQHTVRARLHELSKMGKVYQPFKDNQSKSFRDGKKYGYVIKQ